MVSNVNEITKNVFERFPMMLLWFMHVVANFIYKNKQAHDE